MSHKKDDLTGQKFGKLTVLCEAGRYVAPNSKKRVKWKCLCECGNTKIAIGHDLKNGRVKSCGCLKEHHSDMNNPKREKLYRIWHDIKYRCFNVNCRSYKNYGGRGITMYAPWQNSFEAFYEDVSKLPNYGEQGYTLDRINNDGNYEPNNVRWADNDTQANNKRNCHLITYNGKTQTISQWAKELNINYATLYARLIVLKWSVEKTLTTRKED